MTQNERVAVYSSLITYYKVEGINYQWDGICTQLWKHLKSIMSEVRYDALDGQELPMFFPEIEYIRPQGDIHPGAYWFSTDEERIEALRTMMHMASIYIPSVEDKIFTYNKLLEMDDIRYRGGLCILIEMEAAAINANYNQNEPSSTYFPEFYNNKPEEVDPNGKWFQFAKERRVYLRNLISLLQGKEPEILIL